MVQVEVRTDVNEPARRGGAVVKVGSEEVGNETRVRFDELQMTSVDHANFIVIIIIIIIMSTRH